MKTETTTPKQLAVLKHIQNFENNRCYSATIGEIADSLNLSRSTVFGHIAELRRKKLVTEATGKARSLSLTPQASQLLDEIKRKQSFQQHTSASSNDAIPLVGRVAAGVPIDAIEENQSISLGDVFGTQSGIFSLQVVGDSMIDEGINDGDFVICQKRQTARNGELVIAIVENETATLKKFYQENNRARLQPANDLYKPIYTDNCRIEAVVLGLIRRM